MSAGTVFEHLHRPDSFDHVWEQVTEVAALTRAVGGEHLVVIPEPWRDHKTGAPLESPTLDADGWDRLTTGMDQLGRRVLEEYGLRVQFHSHADSHVGYQSEIERFVESTDPRYVNLCLDTGHVAYYRGDNVAIIRKYPERIGYLHLKQVDPAVIDRVEAEDLPFPSAVQAGAMIEPPYGVPSMPEVLAAIEEAGTRRLRDRRAGHVPLPARPAAADRAAHPHLPRLLRHRLGPHRHAGPRGGHHDRTN